ncbi:trafficking protein particle complex subunit 2-like protein [Heterostelium album PN500]|uniref:Trafficking protein particle complex subunit 2-like protein n=1 Tax=Heterostelium pallidum (strain ATCC 26659 / Pp 5 / PN500) TaxID=670386 RepID=D3BCL9_HETP5|nr:trafficking protein particle complex subunit 2-like protein [Heterostelium album PN500]EFA80661.1 trafficking protein particle complex subunit 2-like protein [Heterostelium album PN500]|eukprot:XP_020432781.1 trafficking protein particle complex subunit 2-like protein [Heterostelium album PN500]
MKKIVCVAVVGKANDPLYFQDFSGGTEENRLKLHYIVHCSLDIIEDKPGVKKVSNDMYLGLLYPTEDYKVYGFLTNTKIKFIIVVLDTTDIKDSDIKVLHLRYVRTASNPFYKANKKIESKIFQNDVAAIVQSL